MKKKFFTFVSAVALLMVSCGPINTDTPPVGNEDKEEQEGGVEEEEQQPDNVILYTTVDGTKLFPTTTEPQVFGAFLVSNTYEDGQGVLTFDDTITSIGKMAFQSCTLLTSITIPDSVTRINSYAFSGCTSLTSITIPDSVTSIGHAAFDGCTSLTSVTIPESVTSIGELAFKSCSLLTSITIPDSVTEIEMGAFAHCDRLTSVYCKAVTPPAGGWDMFDYNASGRKIYVPTESVDAYKTAKKGWREYADAIVGYDF